MVRRMVSLPRRLSLVLFAVACGAPEAAPTPLESEASSAAPVNTPSSSAESQISAAAPPTASAAPLAFDLSPWGHSVLLDPLPGMHVSLDPNPELVNVIVEVDGGLELQVLRSFGDSPSPADHRKTIGGLLANTKFLEEEILPNGFVIVWETDCAFGTKRETGFSLYDRTTKRFCQSSRICKNREQIEPLIKTCKSMRPKG